jgi:formiminotetrahydrofolate cyclodeaminase
LSDAAVAAVQAGAAAVGAHLNVIINLPMVDDDDFATVTAEESKAIAAEVERAVERLVVASKKRLEP